MDERKLLKWNAVPDVYDLHFQNETHNQASTSSDTSSHLFLQHAADYAKVAADKAKEKASKLAEKATLAAALAAETEELAHVAVAELVKKRKIDSTQHDHCYVVSTKQITEDADSQSGMNNVIAEKTVIDYNVPDSGIHKEEDLKIKLQKTYRKIKQLEENLSQLKENYQKIFNEDQIHFLQRGSHRGEFWSDDTVNKALKLYMACGKKGYEEIRKQNLPYPSERTLTHRIQNLKFRPGLLTDVCELLEHKISTMQPEERHAVLLMDEMAIKPCLVFDNSLKEVLGKCTMELSESASNNELATHALVFMLAGITTRWKQTVQYEFTGNSYNPNVVKEKIFEIIKMSSKSGITTKVVISDMGPQNKSLWKILNINAPKHGKISNFISHPWPNEKTQSLYVMPDPVHIFKNVANSLVNGHSFNIDRNTVETFELLSDVVGLEPIKIVYELDQKDDLKLVPFLKPEMFNPSHFDRMNVALAFSLLNHNIAAAIEYHVAKEHMEKKHLATAWFIKIIFRWFKIMTGRHKKYGLNKVNEQIYNETVNFLKSFMEIVRGINVINKNGQTKWKPFQSGLLLATQTALDLHQEYLEIEDFKYLLLGRLTQDAIENLFSLVRKRSAVPNASEFKTALRLICLSQFNANINHSNYAQDDSEFLIKYIRMHNKKAKIDAVEEDDVEKDAEDDDVFQNLSMYLPLDQENDFNNDTQKFIILPYWKHFT